jgi:hypothetical protein
MRATIVICVAVLGFAAAPANAQTQYVGKAKCQADDPVETGLQGQVPLADRASGRAASGYRCNLKEIGALQTQGWISLDTYGNCAYFSDTEGGVDTGTLAVDVSDPAKPTRTAYLTSPAMGNTWESMKINARRGLLAAGHDGVNVLDVYDVKTDCRQPKLLFSGEVPTGIGHEGFFAPDGNTYYMAAYGDHVSPIDLADPAHPKELDSCIETFCQIHGGSLNEAGTRGYFAQVNSPDGLAVVDTSDIQARKNNPEMKSIATLPFPWNAANQATIPVTYGGRPHLVSFGELTINPAAADSGAPFTPHCPTQGETNFDFPRILDIADETKPKIVTKLMNEVMNPVNCPFVAGDNTMPTAGTLTGDDAQTKILLSALFAYDAHYCSIDRSVDPTLLGCGQALSGVRLYDIRDPQHVSEIAYYVPGTVDPAQPNVDSVGARPIIRSDLGQVWAVSFEKGFKVFEFAKGVWPFPDTPRCPAVFDPYLAHYDLHYERDCGHAQATPAGTPVTAVATRGLTVRARRVGSRRLRVEGRLLLAKGIGAQTCRGGVIDVRVSGGRRATAKTRLDARCRFTRLLTLAGRGRTARVQAAFRGTNRLKPAKAKPLSLTLSR